TLRVLSTSRSGRNSNNTVITRSRFGPDQNGRGRHAHIDGGDAAEVDLLQQGREGDELGRGVVGRAERDRHVTVDGEGDLVSRDRSRGHPARERLGEGGEDPDRAPSGRVEVRPGGAGRLGRLDGYEVSGR